VLAEVLPEAVALLSLRRTTALARDAGLTKLGVDAEAATIIETQGCCPEVHDVVARLNR
jgi:hypothetical protein